MRKRNVTHRYLFFAIVLAVSIFASGGSAFGQFVVQPMRIDQAVLPNHVFETAIGIQSSDPNEVHTFDLSVVDMTQWEDGSWRIIEPDSDFDTSTLSSCRNWISLGRETVQIPLMGATRVKLTIKAPRRTRGFYAAGILATLRPRPDLQEGNVGVRWRFLISVLIDVEGRPLRHKVELGDMGLEFVRPLQANAPSTNVLMNIENKGGTHSRLKAFTVVKGFLDGHWREITTAEFSGTRITPGAKLKLRSNIKPLPAAKYRLSGVLYVDGRRAKRITQEIDFASDPSITKVAADAPLDVLPSEVYINCRPGLIRTAAIKVYNASDETVNVRAAVGLPRTLMGVAFGDLKGNDLNCSGWLKIEPENFTLHSHRQQSIRIIAEMPETVAMNPCYYAMLGLFSTYADGQRAGVTTANICVANDNISAEPFIHGMHLSSALKEGSEYYIVARYGNFGRIHFTPTWCRAAIVDGMGTVRIRTSLSSRKSGLMLPFEARDFSGVIDFSNIPTGMYRLAAVLRYASNEEVMLQKAIRVMAQGGRKVIEVVQLQEELGEKIEVKW